VINCRTGGVKIEKSLTVSGGVGGRISWYTRARTAAAAPKCAARSVLSVAARGASSSDSSRAQADVSVPG